MKKISAITALGFLTLFIASPFMSITQQWKDYALMLCGLVIILLSLAIRRELHEVVRALYGDETVSVKDTYVENNPQ